MSEDMQELVRLMHKWEMEIETDGGEFDAWTSINYFTARGRGATPLEAARDLDSLMTHVKGPIP